MLSALHKYSVLVLFLEKHEEENKKKNQPIIYLL